MNDNDIKRNIIVSVVGLVSILSLLLFEISLVGSDINFYLLLIMGLGLILFIVLLIGALKEKQKKKRGQYQKKLAPKRNVQDLLRYEKMFESGICEIVPNYYSKSVRFSDVNYQIAQQDEQLLIFQKYGELLNSLDDTIHLTITILKKELSLMR